MAASASLLAIASFIESPPILKFSGEYSPQSSQPGNGIPRQLKRARLCRLWVRERANYCGNDNEFRETRLLTRVVFFTVVMLAQGGHMQSLYVIKPRFQDLLRPLTTRLAHAGVTANQVTLATCFM